MKAVLLAAGLGTRLRPLTEQIPKCLVPINNVPLIEYWFRLFEKSGISHVLINTHYLHKKVGDYIKNYTGNLIITLSYEKKLLGSLGTIICNKSFWQNEKEILICYADNLTNIDLSKFIEFHKSHTNPITIGLFKAENPKECGIVELDRKGKVISFEEKPKNPKSNLANAGIYIFEIKVLGDYVCEENKILDIGFDFLPKYVNKMSGYVIKEFLIDIGTMDKYNFANEYVKKTQNF